MIYRSTIIKFRNHQKNTTKLSKTTINNGLTHLSTFFKTIIADRLYSYHPTLTFLNYLQKKNQKLKGITFRR